MDAAVESFPDVDFIAVQASRALLLTAAPEGFEGPMHVQGLSGYPYRILRPLTDVTPVPGADIPRYASPAPGAAVSETEQEETTQESQAQADEDAAFKRKFRRHKVPLDSDDHYEVLGLAHLRWKATPEQIRIAYRQLSLLHHPDKCQGSDEVFKKINKAYEVLSNPEQRQIFDSTETFDDHVPTEREAEASEFFSLFGPVFERNARWSSRETVPDIGDASTPWEKVSEFYEFWFNFKSWREFPLEDMYDPEDAECREEKRWMLRQNEKRKLKLKKEEAARIRRLVELANRKDPRVQKYERDKLLAKEAKKAQKQEEARKRAEKAEQQERRAERLAAEREAAEKKRLEDEIRHSNKVKTKLRHLAKTSAAASPDLPVVEKAEILITRLVPKRIEEIVTQLEAHAGVAAAKLIVAEATAIEEEVARQKAEADEKARIEAEEKARASSRPWTVDELSLLAKAIQRFPGGCHERWEKVSGFIGTRTVAEVLDKHQSLKSRTARGVVTTSAYDILKDKVKDKVIDSPLDQDWDRINKSGGGAAAKKGDAPAELTQKEYPASVKDWTQAEQKQLETGLKQFKGKDKWDKIIVQGKSKEECIARFAYLRDVLSAKQAAAAPKK